MTSPVGGSFSTNKSRSAGFVLYINGLEVPCKSVSVRHGVWQVPEIQLEMVADPVLTRIGAEDRMQVAVFYLDQTPVDDSIPPQLRLLGEGEVTGWGYQNTGGGRSIVLTCVNQIQILNQLFVHYLSNIDDMAGYFSFSGSGGADISVAASQIVFPFSLFTKGLIPSIPPGNTNPTTADDIKNNTDVTALRASITRPFDFMYNIIQNMIGSQVPANQKSVPAVNFFTRWARLTNFHNRFVASPLFDEIADNVNIFPVLRALQDISGVDAITQNLLPQVQNAGSLMHMLELCFQSTITEMAMIPSMPLLTVDLLTSLIQPTDFKSHTLTEQADNTFSGPAPAPLTPRRIPNYFAKPQMLFGIPPTCNVFFPSQVKMMGYNENYAAQPTRLYFNDATLTNLFNISNQGGFGPTVMNALTLGYPPAADSALKSALVSAGRLNGKNCLLFPEEFFKGPVLDRRTVPPWMFFLYQAEFAAAKDKDAALLNPIDNARDPQVTPAAKTGARTTINKQPVPAGVINTGARVGTVGSDGKRVYDSAVEALRPAIKRLNASTGMPDEFLLAWIQHESSGSLRSAPTHLNERGYFQIEGPHNSGGKYITDTESKDIGLTVADTGTNASTPIAEARLSNDSDFSIQAGITLALHYKKIAQYYSTFQNGDLYRLTKLFHADPTTAHNLLNNAKTALGHAPTTWQEAYTAAYNSLGSDDRIRVDRSTGIGGVVQGSTGSWRDAAGNVTGSIPVTPAPAGPTGPAASNANPGNPPPAATDTEIAAAVEIAQPTVYQLFSAYEFFRERYVQRMGSLNLSFNPYVVAGFPMAVFDQRATRVDLFGYVTTVQQRISNEGGQNAKSTTVSFSYGRTIQEMFDLMALEFQDPGATITGAAPREPIRDIRKISQSFTASETYYKRLFYGDQDIFGKDASFDWRKTIGYEDGTRIFINGPDEGSQDVFVSTQLVIKNLTDLRDSLAQSVLQANNNLVAAQALAFVASGVSTIDTRAQQAAEKNIVDLTAQLNVWQLQLDALNTQLSAANETLLAAGANNAAQPITHNLDGTREIAPLPEAEKLFDDYDAATRFNWRPICTLDEYILFYNSKGEGLIPAFGHPRSIGAPYYTRIRRLSGLAPGAQPPAGADGLTTVSAERTTENEASLVRTDEGAGPTDALITPASVVPSVRSDNFPQTRANWDEALIAYANNVYVVKAPRT